MTSLVSFARWELIILVVSFAGLTFWKLWQSASFAGLLRSADGTLSPGRIQLLVLTIMTAMQYLLAVINDPTQLPTIPPELVLALGGSQVIYLGSKAWTKFNKTGDK